MAAPALIKALADDNPGIRWLAGEGLITLGWDGVIPLLKVLIQHGDSVRLREGARHVLHTWAKEGFSVSVIVPVLVALEGVEPAMAVPLVAHAALATLRQKDSS